MFLILEGRGGKFRFLNFYLEQSIMFISCLIKYENKSVNKNRREQTIFNNLKEKRLSERLQRNYGNYFPHVILDASSLAYFTIVLLKYL